MQLVEGASSSLHEKNQLALWSFGCYPLLTARNKEWRVQREREGEDAEWMDACWRWRWRWAWVTTGAAESLFRLLEETFTVIVTTCRHSGLHKTPHRCFTLNAPCDDTRKDKQSRFESRLLTQRIRWPTVISWFPSGWGWAGLCGPRSTRSRPKTVQETGVWCRGISAAARSQCCPSRQRRPRPWFHPWTRPRRTWPGWAYWWRVAAGRPSAGARRRGSLSPDCPPARPRWSARGSMENKEAAEEEWEKEEEEEESLRWLQVHSFREDTTAAAGGENDDNGEDAFSRSLHSPMESHW